MKSESELDRELVNDIAELVKDDKNVILMREQTELTTRQLVVEFMKCYIGSPGWSSKDFGGAFYSWIDRNITNEGDYPNEIVAEC